MKAHQDEMKCFHWAPKFKQLAYNVLLIWAKMERILKFFKKILRLIKISMEN